MVEEAGTTIRAAVVGTGLIGGSILLRLRAEGFDVTGWDPDPGTRSAARRQGLRFPDDLTDAVRDRDVVFLGGPLLTLPETLAEVAAVTADECVITDVGSAKSAVAETARAKGLAHRFVPGHPMAGTERAGFTAASPGLFEGAAWVLCPLAGATPAECPDAPAALDRFRALSALITGVFAARVVPMAPPVHDSVVALSSHVPHLLAGSLAGAVAGSPVRDAVLRLAAGSFRDGTRVAGTPAERTAAMLMQNREYVLRQLEPVTAFLAELTAALRAADAGALVGHYRRAQALRAALSGEVTRSERRFPLGVPVEEELEFLLGLGVAGAYLTACVRDAEATTYTVHGV